MADLGEASVIVGPFLVWGNLSIYAIGVKESEQCIYDLSWPELLKAQAHLCLHPLSPFSVRA